MLLLFAVLCFGGSLAGATPVAADDAAPTPTEELVERYAPVLVVRIQPEPCGEGEPYSPMAVDGLFGREGFVLRGPGGVTIDAPDEADLAAAEGSDWYLDVPGNALQPGCGYERLYRSMVASGEAALTTYARVTTDAERPGVLVVQYWLFSLYNDWNDRHEGDWEMIQLLFEADDVAGALATSPSTVAFAQHEGAELSDWEGGPLQVSGGSHPVVFVAEGSHASYFSAEQWFGKSAQSGFGCDNTLGPGRRVEPQVTLLDEAAPPAWLGFEGHWGEQRPSFNNGPTGPITKTQWTAPVRWVEDEGRFGAVALPAEGSKVTDFFCTATAFASKALFRLLDRPWVVSSIGLGISALVVVLIRRTRWFPASVRPVAQRRRLGQILTSTVSLVRRRPRQFARIGSLMLVAGVVATALQSLVVNTTEAGDLADVVGRSSPSSGILGVLLGLIVVVPVTGLVSVAAIDALMTSEADTPVRLRDSLRIGRRHLRVLRVQLIVGAMLGLSVLTLVLVPVGLWWAARWAVAMPVAAGDGTSPLRRSAQLTRGALPRSLSMVLINVTAVSTLPALTGVLLLLATDASFRVVNLVASLVGVFTVPASAVAVALLHVDLVERERSSTLRGSPSDGVPGVVDEGAVVG